MQAILIDVTAREIRAVDYDGLKDLQRLVGGFIATATAFDNGDVLFVDDEGLFKAPPGFFRVKGIDQPFAGNGVLVGEEHYDGDGEYLGIKAPGTTVAELSELVEFRSRAQVDAWAKANAAEPSSTFTTIERDGSTTTTVLGTYGGLFADLPRQKLPEVGQRIRAVAITVEPERVPPGTAGLVISVIEVDQYWQVAVAWENGSKLSLNVPPDQWEAV
jgi:Domain of unknown function (DUF3846)/Domain of unknown function (DUF4314)